jgi:hypothetical protein
LRPSQGFAIHPLLDIATPSTFKPFKRIHRLLLIIEIRQDIAGDRCGCTCAAKAVFDYDCSGITRGFYRREADE